MRLLLGVTGGIAAYRACELTSLAVKGGHEVRVMMTRRATAFVGPLTFAGLSGQRVFLDEEERAMDHIELSRWADLVCVAPLTAHTLGRLACGLADDLLSATMLALPGRVPRVLAPAMNSEMWQSPLVQRNLGWLSAMPGVRIVEPVEKRLACGEFGPGGLAEPAAILAACELAWAESRNLTLT